MSLFTRLKTVHRSRSARVGSKNVRIAPLRLFALEDRLSPSVTAIGAADGVRPRVQILDANGVIIHSFDAYDPAFLGGVDVDQGDVNGDDVPDIITAAGPGGGPHVKVFDGVTYAEIRSFMAYDLLFTGGVNVASGNLRNNGICDIITAPRAGGGPHVKVFDGQTLTELQSFMAYDTSFFGGVSVASGQMEADFENDILTAAGPGGGPHVKAFDGVTGQEISSFMAYDIAFRGGVEVASGDFDNNKVPDIVTAPATAGGPHIKVWENSPEATLKSEFLAFGGATNFGVTIGSVDGADNAPDLIAAAPRINVTPSGLSAFATYNLGGDFVETTSFGGENPISFRMSSNADEAGLTYSGETQHGMVYSPTWLNWQQQFDSGVAQLSDSDMANDAFRGLWDVDGTGQGRRDLTAIATKEAGQTKGFNLVRLFDWEPGRGWDGSKGVAHLSFLDKAQQLGMKVIVPISNYFLSNDRFAWVNNSTNPNSNYDFSSGTSFMQTALPRFLSSVTVNGQIHPAVHSFAIGNELDLGITMGTKVNPTPPPPTLPADPVNAASKLARALWWVKNLHERMVQQGSVRQISIPISNGDQGAGPGQNKSWFQCILRGVQAGELVPHGAVNGTMVGGTFAFTVPGLSRYDWYKTGFYNSYQVYQQGQGLQEILQQYDNGGVGGNDWSHQWPGEKFDVPLMLTELGKSRSQLGQSDPQQFDWIANQQARVVESYLRQNSRRTNIMGYAIFEFNDESDKHGPLGALDATFGIHQLVSPQSPSGNIQFQLNTGTTLLPDGRPAFGNFSYPVYQLFAVTNGSGRTLLSELKTIFNEM